MAKTIAISNQKGGVGKTTSTYNIGAALAQLGKKVLMVDLDSQASLTIATGLEPMDCKFTICDILKKNSTRTEETILSLEDIVPGLFLIPSIIDLAVAEENLNSRTIAIKVLESALNQIKNKFDYILIDCPPQLGKLVANALVAADGVIIPVKTNYLAYRGLKDLTNTINEVKEYMSPHLEILGVIATLFEMTVKDDKEVLQEMQKEYKVIGIVKKAAATNKGIYEGLPVVLNEPKSDVAIAYKEIAQKIIEMEE